jgi:hypothetical protein
MTTKRPYTYVVLRYVHDTATAEFINVGVVLHCPELRFFDAKLRHTHRRLSAMFPNLDTNAFRTAMTAIERALKSVGRQYKTGGTSPSGVNAGDLARSVLPSDDSSLQWSPVGSGLTAAPADEVVHLFDRLVGSYDDKPEHRRTDAEIWRPVREKLEPRLSAKLTTTTIRGAVDEIQFKHAWKNGVWHCYEPVSFDLATADGIKTKARQWTGHLTAVRDVAEEFLPYFIVGKPSEPKLKGAYDYAIAILERSPVRVQIFSEDRATDLVAQIERDMAAEGF